MRQTASPIAATMPLTILTWDIAGSCALLSALSLEEYCRVLRACQEQAASTIEAHGGFVARYMGDSVLAYFGFPRASDDDPERAVRAALALKLRWRHRGIMVRSRVAIASGPVIVGREIGLGAAREFPAFGEAPNLAARLIGVAEPEEIVVSDATASALGGIFALKPLENLSLKGLPHITHAWRVTPPVRWHAPGAERHSAAAYAYGVA